jgi:hypothetical protein
MFNQGNIVKMNPEIFAGNESLTDTFGSLGVPGLFRHMLFEIVKSVKDGRGEGYTVKLLNPDKLKTFITGVKEVKSEGEWYLLASEIVKANTKITLDYEIAASADQSGRVEELFLARKKLRSEGKDKKHKEMIANWRAIEVARGKIKGESNAEKVEVFLPKQRMTVTMTRGQLPKEGDDKSLAAFMNLLVSELVRFRNARKATSPVTKELYGKQMTLVGGVHTSPSQPLDCFKHFMRNWASTPKKPTDAKATYVGIEIEMIYSGEETLFKELMFQEKLYRNVTMTTDGSVKPCHNQGYRGIELQVLCTTEEVKSVLESLQRVFDNPKIDGYANRSCGLHIHCDMRNRDHKLAYKNLVRVQNILRGAQPVGRINNIHCRPNTNDSFVSNIESGDNGRYWVVNHQAYKEHTTLEVRIHEGTTECKDIYNWIVFLDTIVSLKTEIPVNSLTLASQLNEKYSLAIPDSSVQYIDTRVKRFNSLSVG